MFRAERYMTGHRVCKLADQRKRQVYVFGGERVNRPIWPPCSLFLTLVVNSPRR